MPRGETPTFELVESLTALKRTLRCVEHLGEGKQSVGFAGLGVLAYIQRNQPTRATDIAQWIGIGPAALSRQVVELESSGLLVRTPSPTDARAQLISLTPRGVEELESAYDRRATVLAGLLKDWDEAEIAAAAATVNNIQQVLRAGLDSIHVKNATAPNAPEENPHV
ncbi:MarR family winged helix-turn-helix transcriptional regulator [Paeniglutamicibacter sp. MACA_103]|uniref:MarR family winged helix-turn-helix transcriptional regulator n=1 Tax=Paeniglutamicibacter sp. MACA_103 TaxID=3377337 RepID=UPI003893BA75